MHQLVELRERIGGGRQADPETVILLHCSASSPRQWTALIEALPARFEPVAIELLGHGGRACWPGDGPLSLTDEADAIARATEAAGAPVHLIGHSYGGGVALRFALDRGDRLRSLTLVEPSCFSILSEHADDAEYLAEIEAVVGTVSGHVIAGDYRAAMQVFIDYWAGEDAWRGLDDGRKASFASMAVLVAHHFSSLLNADIRLADLARIDVPTLIVCGTRSPKPSRAITRRLAEIMPRASHRTIGFADHMAVLTRPEIVNPVIIEHLAKNAAGGSES